MVNDVNPLFFTEMFLLQILFSIFLTNRNLLSILKSKTKDSKIWAKWATLTQRYEKQ